MNRLGTVQSYVNKIPLSAEGMVELWDDAWAATQRAMGYSVEALSQTRDIDSFLRAVKPQAALTKLIGSEVHELTGSEVWGRREYNRGLLPDERRTLLRWHHDRYASQAVVLCGVIELSKLMPNLDSSWYKRARRTYAFSPSLSHIINGAVEAHVVTLRMRDIAIDVDVDDNDVYFVNRHIRQLATDIITNLISNAVKYSRNGGMIRIVFRDRTFSVEDEGVGMDAPFASLLGQPDPIRENRAEGVDGFGFGWTTIGRALDKLGWRRAIDTEPNVGSKFTMTMREGHLLSQQRVTPVTFDETDLFEILVQGSDILNGARPLADYHIISGNFLDVSESPAAWVINAVSRVDAQYATPN